MSEERTILPWESTQKELDWRKKIHGELKTFGEGENLVWGIELHITVDDELRSAFKKQGIKIPRHINDIVFLTLTPEEELSDSELSNYAHPSIRNKTIKKKRLGPLVDYEKVGNPFGLPQLETLRTYIKEIVNTPFLRVMFNYYLKKNEEKTSILIVNAHGGRHKDEHHVGEAVGYQYTDRFGKKLHKKGNFFPTQELIASYKGTSHAAILLGSCNKHDDRVTAYDAPVFYPKSLFYHIASGPRKSPIRIARPTTWL